MQLTTDPNARAAPSDTPLRWPLPSALIHWGTVGLLVIGVAVAYGREAVDGRGLRDGLLNVHRWAGVLVWAACWMRLALRLFKRPRGRRPATGRFMTWAATATHVALYGLLLAVPLLGWALSSARGQSLEALGWHLPVLFDRDPDLADELAAAHSVAALTLLGLASLHALAALWHHFIRGDGVLASMAFARAKPRAFSTPRPGLPSSSPAEPT